MNTSAIILMSVVWVSVIALTSYFFAKILRNPKHAEPHIFDVLEELDEE